MKRLAIAMAIGSLMACGDSPVAPTPPANIAGSYNASVTASSTCSAILPSETRVLNYSAEVTQAGATAQVLFNPHGGTPVTVAATVSGQTINFPNVSFSGNIPGVGAISVVATTGKATVAAGGEIAGTLSGTYQTGGTSCAGDHQIKMSRCVVTCAGNVCVCA